MIESMRWPQTPEFGSKWSLHRVYLSSVIDKYLADHADGLDE